MQPGKGRFHAASEPLKTGIFRAENPPLKVHKWARNHGLQAIFSLGPPISVVPRMKKTTFPSEKIDFSLGKERIYL
jgi:hypothetical protein